MHSHGRLRALVVASSLLGAPALAGPPAGGQQPAILLTRTSYDADKLTRQAASAHLGPNLSGYDNPTDVIIEGGHIWAKPEAYRKAVQRIYHAPGEASFIALRRVVTP